MPLGFPPSRSFSPSAVGKKIAAADFSMLHLKEKSTPLIGCNLESAPSHTARLRFYHPRMGLPRYRTEASPKVIHSGPITGCFLPINHLPNGMIFQNPSPCSPKGAHQATPPQQVLPRKALCSTFADRKRLRSFQSSCGSNAHVQRRPIH